MFVSQIDPVPKLAAAIQTRREARGLSQSELAQMAGLSVNTISRWEQGRFRPKGKDAIAFLKQTLDFTQEELDQLYLDAVMREARSRIPVIEDASFLTRHGMSHEALLTRLLEIDHATVPHLCEQDAGEVQHWVEIFKAQPHGWRLLVLGGHFIGYWHFMHLKPAPFEAAKTGALREADLRHTDLADWVTAYTAQPARIFISAITIDTAHQHPTLGMALIRSLLIEIDRLTKDGFAIDEICTVAYSANALHMCKSLGMKRRCKQTGYRPSEIADVYAASAKDILKARVFKRVIQSRPDV